MQGANQPGQRLGDSRGVGSTQPTRYSQLFGGDQDLGVREMAQPARVVGVEMRHDHGPHVGRADADFQKTRPDLVFGLNIGEPDRQPEVQMPSGEVAGFSCARAVSPVSTTTTPSAVSMAQARIGRGSVHEVSSRMLTCLIGAVPTPDSLALFDADGPRLDRVDLCHRSTDRFGVSQEIRLTRQDYTASRRRTRGGDRRSPPRHQPRLAAFYGGS